MLTRFRDGASEAYRLQDENPLADFPARFENPTREVDGRRADVRYYVNHSLGRKPKATPHSDHFQDLWGRRAVEGHFAEDETETWYTYDERFRPIVARLFGAADESEVALASGGLSENLFKLARAFYQPSVSTPNRNGIITIGNDFYSDQHIARSLIEAENSDRRRFGISELSDSPLIELQPQDHRDIVVTQEQILNAIAQAGKDLELVLIPEVHFLTGVRYNTNAITQAAHEVGAKTVVDAAHAVGNVAMRYSEYGPDAAAACTYKYLGSAPGNDAIIYLNSRTDVSDLSVGRGWFSHTPDTRFKDAGKNQQLAPGASGLRMSNTNMAAASMMMDALEIVDEAGIERIEKIARLMVDYFLFRLRKIPSSKVKIITPEDPDQRGAMVTLSFSEEDRKKVEKILEKGRAEVDWRDPGILRVSFTPIHNTFIDVYDFAGSLQDALED